MLHVLEPRHRCADHALATAALGNREAAVVRGGRHLAGEREEPQLGERHPDRAGELERRVGDRQLRIAQPIGIRGGAPQPRRHSGAEVAQLGLLRLLRRGLRCGAVGELLLSGELALLPRLGHPLLLELELLPHQIAERARTLAQLRQPLAQLRGTRDLVGRIERPWAIAAPEAEPRHLLEDDVVLVARRDPLEQLFPVLRRRQLLRWWIAIHHQAHLEEARGGWLPSSTPRTGLLCSSGRVDGRRTFDFSQGIPTGIRLPSMRTHSIERASEACGTSAQGRRSAGQVARSVATRHVRALSITASAPARG